MVMLKKQLGLAVIGAISFISSSFAAPKQLVTHNLTSVESNGFIDGVIPSQHPTKAHSENRVFWASVKLACYGRVVNNSCKALIKMGTDTPNPVDLGWLSLNLITGEITPTSLSGNGYHLEVNGPGETTLTEE
jgi:hypothetical protein